MTKETAELTGWEITNKMPFNPEKRLRMGHILTRKEGGLDYSTGGGSDRY